MDLGKRPDFESWDKKLEESDKGKPGVGIPDFESWDKKITAREEVEQRGPLGDIVSGIVRGVAVEMPSLALDIAGTTERVAREAFGFKEGPGDIEQAAQKGEESLRGFQSRHSILRPHEKPEATEEAPLLEPSGKKYGFFDKLREMTDEPSDILDYIPFVAGAKDVSEVATVAASAYKLDQGTATQEDQDRLVEFLREANKDTTFGYKVLDVVAEMPAFMGEFLLTSGIYTAGKKVGTKAATSAIKKYLGKSGEKLLKSKIGSLGLKVAGGVAGGTVQAPIMGLPRIISGTIERSMPHVRLTGDEKGELSAMVSGKGEDLIPAALKSFGDQWAETISEHSGGLFAKLGTMGKNLAIKSGLLSSFIKANPARSPGKAIKLFKSVGYHGVINEMAEERLGEVLRAGIGVTEEYNLPTAEQLGVELVAFSVPGVAQAIASHIESKGEDTETPPTDPESTETPPADFKPQEDGGTPFSPDEVLSRKDDVRNHIALAIGTGEINDNQAHELGRNIGLGLDETNQALIRGMGIQRMLKYADPLELKPFAAEQGIDVPASVTDGNQIATIIQEGLKEEGSVIAELAKQVKNLEKTAATRGMEHTAKNLEEKKAALDQMLPAAEEEEVYGEAPPIEKGFEKEAEGKKEISEPEKEIYPTKTEPEVAEITEPEVSQKEIYPTEAKPETTKPPWEMTVDEFEKFAEGGKIHKATGKELPGEAEAKTPLAMGEINKYAPEDIARFYLQKHTGKDGTRTPEMVKAAHDELISDAVAEGRIAKSAKPEKVAEPREPKEELIKKYDQGWQGKDEDLHDTWLEMYEHGETIKAENQPKIDALNEEFKPLKSKRDKASVQRKKEIKAEIKRLRSESENLHAEYENKAIDIQLALREEAIEKAKKAGFKEDAIDDFIDDFSIETSGEQPYIGRNYGKTKQEIFDELIAEYKEKEPDLFEKPTPSPEKTDVALEVEGAAKETKKQKSLREYNEYIDDLTPEQMLIATDLIVVDPEFPSQQKRKIEKKLAKPKLTKAQKADIKRVDARTKKVQQKRSSKKKEAEIKTLQDEKNKILGVKAEEKAKPVDIEDEIKATPIEDIEAMFDEAVVEAEKAERPSLQEIFDTFDENEVAGLRVGMFPVRIQEYNLNNTESAELMRMAEKATAKERGKPAKPETKTAADIVKRAAKSGVKGVDEATKGLYELFGGAALKSFPAGFDAETYAKAKPHFEEALKQFKEAGQGVKELTQWVVSEFGAAVKPYFMKFVNDLKGLPEKPLTKEKKADTLKEKPKEAADEPTSAELPDTGKDELDDTVRAPVSKGESPERPEGTTEGVGERRGASGAIPGTAKEGREPGGRPDQRDRAEHDRADRGEPAEAATGERRDRDQGVARETVSLTPENRNHVITDDDVIFPKGPETKIKANIKAVQLLKILQSEDRNPTPEEKKTLAQYVGWGQFSQKVFNKSFSDYLDRYRENYTPKEWFDDPADLKKYLNWEKRYGKKLHPKLGGLMTEEEWKSAEESTINAHFTSKPVINAMWDLAERLGFKGGTILEPAAGVGHFFGLMPQSVAEKSSLFGVELDTISGGILEKLYPQAQIEITGFEKSRKILDNSIDLTITNVPFANFGVIDKKHPDYSGWSLHNYFFGRSLTMTKPGGLVVAITTSWSLDAKSNGKVREYLGDKADLVGAIRLPNNAFAETAGTEVVTDILVFRKKDSQNVSMGNDFRVTHKLENNHSKKVERELEAARNKLHIFNMTDGKENVEIKFAAGKDKSTFPLTRDMMNDDTYKIKVKGKFYNPSEFKRAGKQPKRPRYILDRLAQQKNIVEDHWKEYQGLYAVNEYFAENPGMVLGKHSMTGTMYAKDTYTVQPLSGPLEEHLQKVIQEFPEDIAGEGTDISSMEKVRFAELGAKEGTLTKKDGEIYLVDNNRIVAPFYLDSKGNKQEVTGVRLKRTEAYLEIRDITTNLIDTMSKEETTDKDVKTLQNKLNKKYDAYVKKYKHFGTVSNSFLRKVDNDFAVVDALEVETGDRHTKKFEKAPIFNTRTIFPFVEPDTANDIEDAANLSIIYRGGVQPAYIASLTGNKDIEAVKTRLVEKGLAFIDPDTGLMEAKDLYLSGNVKKKLNAAKAAAKDNPIYKNNIKALEAVVPEDMDISFIEFRLGSSWIPPETIKGFLSEVLDVEANVEYTSNDTSSAWLISGESNIYNIKNRETYGTEANYGSSLVEAALNMRRIKIKVTERLPEGGTRTYEDKDASRENNLKIREINSEFVTWAKTHEKWSPIIQDKYNLEKNGHVLRKHSPPIFRDANGKQTFHYPNASTAITLREHQRVAVSRALQESCLLAYGVGTGKTYIYITAAMEMKRIGTAKKPLIVAHNQTIDQYAKSFQTLYPGAKVLIPNYSQRSSRMRKKTLVSMATGDWDAIVLPQSFFDGVANDPARETAFVEEMLDMIDQQIMDAESEEGRNSFTVKDLVKLKQRKRQKLEGLLDRRKDEAVLFEQMGIDALLVDEVHAYKRSEFYTKLNRVKGIDSGSSQRSTSLILKSEFIRSKTGGKNIITATGTPISNTMAELWTMLRYVRPDLLKEYGVTLFDDFASTFGNVIEGIEETASGYKLVERFAEYTNGPELLTMFFTGADVRLTKDAGLKLPKMKGGKPQVIVSEKSPELTQYIQDIIAQWKRWENLGGREKMKQRHVPLVLYGKAKKAAIDLRLIDPIYYKSDPNSKISKAADNIHKTWEETKENRSTQIVFLDAIHDSAKNPKFNTHKDIKEKLVKLGIPAKEIELFSEAGSSEKKQEAMKDRIRSGKSRVIIGHTQRLGIGVDIANKMIAAHHVNVPDRPMDIEQRDGRIIRQGNENEEVQIYHYCTKETLDSVMFGRLVKKQRYSDQVLSGDIEGRTFKDPYSEEQASFAEFAAASSGVAGQLLFEKNDLLAKENEHKVAQTAHIRRVSNARKEIRLIPGAIDKAEVDLKEWNDWKKYVEKTFGEDPSLQEGTIEGETLPRKDLVDKIVERVQAVESKWKKELPGMAFGKYRKRVKEQAGEASSYTDDLIETFTVSAGGFDTRITLTANTNWSHTLKPSTKIAFRTSFDTEAERVLKNVRFDYLKGATHIYSRSTESENVNRNFTRFFNDLLRTIADKPAQVQRQIDELKNNLDEFKKIAKEDFKYQKALAEAQKRIAEINVSLIELSEKETKDIKLPDKVEDVEIEGEGPLYSTTETAEPKSKADKVFDTILPHLQGMTNFPTVRVVQSIGNLPKRLKDRVTSYSKKSNKQVEGFYDKTDDQVFLIADNLSEGRIEAVLRHEAEGHRGIRLLLGSELDGFLDGISKAKKDELLKHDPKLNFKDQAAVRVAADEWCARKIEAGNLGKSFWDDLVRIFRKFMRKFVPNLDLSDGEIRSVLTDTVRNVREGRVDRIRMPEGEGMPLFSAKSDDEISTLEQEIKSLREEFKEKIKTTKIKETVKRETGKLRLSDIVKETRIETRETYEDIARKKKGIALLKTKAERRESLMNARVKKAARDRVNKIIKGLKKIDTSKMSPPQAGAINDILEDIDLTKLSSGKQLRLEKTRQYLENNPDAEMPDYAMKALERLEKTAARDLTLDDLESLNIAVLHHAHLDKVKQKLRVGRQEKQFSNALNGAMGEMKTPKKVRSEIISSQQGSFGKLKKTGRLIADTFGIRHDHFDLIIESLAGQNSIMDKVLYQNIKEGVTEELKYKQQTFKKFQEDLGDFDKKHGIKDLSKWIGETVKTGRIELTRGERMSLYRHSLNADNKKAIIQGGFGFKFSNEPNRVHNITKDEFDSVIDSLTDAEKDFAGKPADNLFADQIERLDKIFLEKNGYALPREENYHPKNTMPLALGKDMETEEALEMFKGKWLRIGLAKGMLEKRKRVQLPIYLNSITHDINTSVSKSAAYIGLEIPLSNASKLLYNPTFRLTLTNRYGEQAWKEIEKGLRDIAGEHRTYTTTEKLLIKAKNKLSTAMLGLNPFVMSKQILSLPVYLPYVKSKYLAMGLIDNIWNPKKITGRHKLYSPEYLERIEGGYSRDVADVFKAGAEKRIYAGKKDIKEKFMSGIKLFDQAAVNMGMHGAVLQTLDEFKAGKLSREVGIALDMKDSEIASLSPEQKMKLAYKFADYATQRTQPMFSPEHRSSLSRGSTVEQLATMFGSFTNQALNLTRRSYREARRTGDKAAYAKFSKSLMVIFVINTLGVMAIDDIRDWLYGREGKTTTGKILGSWSGYMFFVRDLASSVISKIERGTFLGYDVSLPISRVPELLSNTIANGVTVLSEKDIKKRNKAAKNFIDDSLELSTMMSGIPYSTPKKLGQRVLFGAPETKGKEVKSLEKNAKDIKTIRKNYKGLLKSDPGKAVKYYKKHRAEIRLWKYASNVSTRISRLQKRIDAILESKKLSGDAKRRKVELLRAQMLRIAKRFNSRYEKLK